MGTHANALPYFLFSTFFRSKDIALSFNELRQNFSLAGRRKNSKASRLN